VRLKNRLIIAIFGSRAFRSRLPAWGAVSAARWWVRKDGPIENSGDMRGKVIAIPSRFSQAEMGGFAHGLKGVARAKASYPAHQVVIGYDEHLTNEKTLKEFISSCGLTMA
jgi:hypothetical protein